MPTWALTQVPTVPWSVQVTQVPVQARVAADAVGAEAARALGGHRARRTDWFPGRLDAGVARMIGGRVRGRAVGKRAVALGHVRPIVGAGVDDALLAAAAAAGDRSDRAQDHDQSAEPHAHPRGQEERSCCSKRWNSLWRAKNLVYGFRRENRRKTRHDDALRAKRPKIISMILAAFRPSRRLSTGRAQRPAARYRRLPAVSVSSDQSWRA